MDEKKAFESLIVTANEKMEAVQQEGAGYFEEGDTVKVRQAVEKVEAIQALIDHIQQLHQKWNQLFPPSVPETSIDREVYVQTSPGIKTSQEKYRIPILQALVEMDGGGKTGKVLDRVGELMADILNDFDWERLPQNRDIRWRNTAMWERLDMVKEGLLKDQSPNGIWEITESGRAYLKNRMR